MWNLITSDYLRDFRRILFPGVNSSACHLDLNELWTYIWGLKDRGWTSRGRPRGRIETTSPSPPLLKSQSPSDHLHAPMSETKVPKMTLAPLFISLPDFLSSSSSCQLCLVSRQERGRTENGAPRSYWVPLLFSTESLFLRISSWLW